MLFCDGLSSAILLQAQTIMSSPDAQNLANALWQWVAAVLHDSALLGGPQESTSCAACDYTMQEPSNYKRVCGTLLQREQLLADRGAEAVNHPLPTEL